MNIFLCLFFEAIHLQSEPVCLVKPRLFAEKKTPQLTIQHSLSIHYQEGKICLLER